MAGGCSATLLKEGSRWTTAGKDAMGLGGGEKKTSSVRGGVGRSAVGNLSKQQTVLL